MPFYYDPLAGDRAALADSGRDVVVLCRLARLALVLDEGRARWIDSAAVALSPREEERQRQDQRRRAMNAPLSLKVDPS